MAINLEITTIIDAQNRQIAQADLPAANIQITGTATDPNDVNAQFEYSWAVLDKPPTSAAALNANFGAVVNMQNIDVWGTYRIFCIVRNITTGELSSQNPLTAHSSFFVDLSVVSTNRQLEKPARTQRDWNDEYWRLVDVVDALQDGGNGLPMCGVETWENDGDFLIYDTTCFDSPSGDTEGFHAISAREPAFTGYLPKASYGLASTWGDGWNTIIPQLANNPAQQWADDVYYPGIVAVADLYDMITVNGYYTPQGVNLSNALLSTSLTSLVMSPAKFVTALYGNQTNTTYLNTITNEPITGDEKHFVAPLTSLDEFNDYTAATGVAPTANVLQTALTYYQKYTMGRSSIGNLGDVDLTTTAPNDGDVLVWDSSVGTGTHVSAFGQAMITGAWVPAAQSGGGGVQDKILEANTKVETVETQADGSDAHINFTINGEDAFRMFLPVGHDTPNNVLSPWKDCLNDLGTAEYRFRDLHICRDLYVGGNRVAVDSAGQMTVTDSTTTERKVLGYTGIETTDSIIKFNSATGSWETATQNLGTIQGVTAGTGLIGGGTSGFVTLSVSGLTTSEIAPSSLLTSTETFVDTDSQLMTAKAILDLIQANTSTSIVHTFDSHLGGSFTDEVTYNASGYSTGLGRSPLMFIFKNPHSSTLSLKDFSFTCSHMHSTDLQFSFVAFSNAEMLQNIYTTISGQYTMTKTNIDPNVNNEGIGSVEAALGVTIPAGSYFGLMLNGYEKTGQDNQRWHLTVEAMS